MVTWGIALSIQANPLRLSPLEGMKREVSSFSIIRATIEG